MNVLNLSGHFLKKMSNMLGNNSCNDYSLPNTPNNFNFVKKMLVWNGDPENQEPHIFNDKIQTGDSFIVSFLATCLKNNENLDLEIDCEELDE